jgi:hypothetical protein
MTLARTLQGTSARGIAPKPDFLSAVTEKANLGFETGLGFAQLKCPLVILLDTGWDEWTSGNQMLADEITLSFHGTDTKGTMLSTSGCVYVNTMQPFLPWSDVDTSLRGVVHAEEFSPDQFSDRPESQVLLPTPHALVDALEFLPENLISFSRSLEALLQSEARDFGVSVAGFEWSVFTDPQDSSRELVLEVTVRANSDQALDFWDRAAEAISARKKALSPTEQDLLNRHLSVQIYWP